MTDIYTDPVTGRQYTVDPMTGQSRWLDEVPPSHALAEMPDYGTPGSVTPGLGAPSQGYPGFDPATTAYPSVPGGQPNPADPYGQWGQPEQATPYQQPPSYPTPFPNAYPGQQPTQTGGSSSRTGLVIGLIALLVALLGSVGITALLLARDDSKGNTTVSTSSSSGTGEATTVAVNKSMDTADYRITVAQIEYGHDRLMNEDNGDDKDAVGQFAVISYDVTNTSDRSTFFFCTDLSATDSNGDTVQPESSSYIYSFEKDPLNDVMKSGDTVSVVIAFDIPQDATLSTLTYTEFGGSDTVDLDL